MGRGNFVYGKDDCCFDLSAFFAGDRCKEGGSGVFFQLGGVLCACEGDGDTDVMKNELDGELGEMKAVTLGNGLEALDNLHVAIELGTVGRSEPVITDVVDVEAGLFVVLARQQAASQRAARRSVLCGPSNAKPANRITGKSQRQP